MNRLLTTTLSAILAILAATASETDAAKVLDSMSKAFQKAGTLSASYTMTSDGHKSQGEMILSGDRFRLTSPLMTIWYDGKTQWTYNSDIREVNITEPTPEELAETNPFVIISMFRNNYSARLMKSAPGSYRIDFTPRNDANSTVRRAIVTVSSSTFMPTDMAITINGDQTVAVHINSLVQGKNYPLSMFVFNKKSYPKAEIVDLR